MSFQCSSMNAIAHTFRSSKSTIGVSYVKTTAREVKQVKPINFITFGRMTIESLGLSPFLSDLKLLFRMGCTVHARHCTHQTHVHVQCASLAGSNKISVPNITNELCDFRVIYACLITFPLSLASLAPHYVCECE